MADRTITIEWAEESPPWPNEPAITITVLGQGVSFQKTVSYGNGPAPFDGPVAGI